MCIIFYNETGKIYNREHLSVAYDNNPHGVGLMWIEGTKLQTLRGLYSKEKMFEILEHFEGIPHALHLRWRTRGVIDNTSCHPFRASHKNAEKNVYMMHNGTFPNIAPPENRSDTQVFANRMQKITAEHGTDMLFQESFLRKVEKDIQSFNKVIFLRNDRKVAIMNPNSWTVMDGMWLSNTYSLEKDYRKRQTNKKSLQKYISSAQSRSTRARNTNWMAKSEAWETKRSDKKDNLKYSLGEIYDLAYEQHQDQVGRVLSPLEKKKIRRKVRKNLKEKSSSLQTERSLLQRQAFETMVKDSVSTDTRQAARSVVRRRKNPDGSIEYIPIE